MTRVGWVLVGAVAVVALVLGCLGAWLTSYNVTPVPRFAPSSQGGVTTTPQYADGTPKFSGYRVAK